LVANVKEKTMADRKFWLGIIIIGLLFSMIIFGCRQEPEENFSSDLDLVITGLPTDFNGQNFTISLIEESEVVKSKNGVVAGEKASVEFILNREDFKNVRTRIDSWGDTKYYCNLYVAIKIGNNAQIISKNEIEFSLGNQRGGSSSYHPLSYGTSF
jgi:hypothetical protein